MFIRIRLIPITIVFVVLMLIFRIGSIWNGMDAAQVAQAVPNVPSISEPQSNPSDKPWSGGILNLRDAVFAPSDVDTTHQSSTTPASMRLSNIIPDAQAQDANPQNTNTTDDPAVTPASATSNTTSAVAINNNTTSGQDRLYSNDNSRSPRLIDLADVPLRDDPDTRGLRPLSLGLADVSDDDIIDTNTLSVAEVRLLHTLADRRRRLDSRERGLIERESVITAAEQQLNTLQAELEEIRAEIRRNLQIHDERQEQQIVQMREVYSTMNPKQAAQIFNELDMDILVNVLRGMTPRKIAPIVGLMNVQKARDVTLRLADRTTYSITE